MMPSFEPAIVVKKVNDTTIDVFSGNGWSGWTRFLVEFKNNRLLLKLIKGQPMRNEAFSQLYQELTNG